MRHSPDASTASRDASREFPDASQESRDASRESRDASRESLVRNKQLHPRWRDPEETLAQLWLRQFS